MEGQRLRTTPLLAGNVGLGENSGAIEARLPMRLAPARAKEVAVAGRIEAAVGGRGGAEGAPDQDEGGAGDADSFRLVADVSEGAAQHQFVWPADAVRDDGRTIGAVTRQQAADDPREIGD